MVFGVTKNIYAGVEASFLFGNITHSSDALSHCTVSTRTLRVTHLNRANYSDIVWKLGAAWRPKLSDTWTLNLGATYDRKYGLRPLRRISTSKLIKWAGHCRP